MQGTEAAFRVERMVAERVDAALVAVERTRLPRDAADALTELAHSAAVRQS
jgi:hypothetical protein